MKLRINLATFFLLLQTGVFFAQQQPRVEMFSPQGTVKKVRQVRVRFSETMVPIGDPRQTVEPFDIQCPEKGTARWADSRNWIYDFERDLPAGVRCEFILKAGLKTLAGNEIVGQRTFAFSTGGPSIVLSEPHEGSTFISEDQIFILELDGEPVENTLLSSVSFVVEGISERVGIRIVSGEERELIVKTHYRYRHQLPAPVLLIQARQRFPAGARVRFVWGRGVTTRSGIGNVNDQILAFQTRTPFAATFHCQRENPTAACIPIGPMRLAFSAPVAWEEVRKAILRGPGGKQWAPQVPSEEDEEKYVHEVVFNGPFPEKTEFSIQIPPGLEDDAGRKLTNANKFPISVRTDEFPPLAKFAANFGILELNAHPLLPVTLRNVEPQVTGRLLNGMESEEPGGKIEAVRNDKTVSGRIKGKLLKISSGNIRQILFWLALIERRGWDDRAKSVFGAEMTAKAKTFSIPKLHGAKAFEVVGIPIPAPGFYVAEIESELLGAALLGMPKPMFVQTAVLVTNLSVHLKRGIESSLVWVTTLDKARPVQGALVQVRDCEGKLLWEGPTDPSGITRTDKLPASDDLPRCSGEHLDGGLMVTAQLGEDMAFVHSSWQQGIEPWRFRLPTEWNQGLIVAHTVFDRALLRAGESVHMKHFLRRQVMSGFSLLPESARFKSLIIQHWGSEQKYELPLQWDSNGIAETTWSIPREAKLGWYQVSVSSPGDKYSGFRPSGRFRVEEYRVPLMKGIIRPPSGPLTSPTDVTVDLSVSYLAGGAAGNLPVKFRHHVQSAYGRSFEGFEDFFFANGAVREGLVRTGTETEEGRAFELKSVDLTLDKTGSARTTIAGLTKSESPKEILTELEFRDPNGEVQTVASRIPLWPANWLVGIKPDSWALSKDSLRFQVAVADLRGNPVAGAPVQVDLFQRKTYSHRKRLVGGFYAYEHFAETKKIGPLCEGKSDKRGLVLCDVRSPVSGNVILQAVAKDSAGRETIAHQDVWVAGKEDWWFEVEDGDRIDLLPERKNYEPGERARFQVRMPFRRATALVAVEREGVGDTFVKELSGKQPVIEIPVKGSYAPNVFVSVLVVRGRVSGVQPTAMIDLGRPAYKLGIAGMSVGWKAHELKVKVSCDRPTYKVREKAKVNIQVKTAEGQPPQPGSEVALAAVDEGLLELMPNSSWNLLEAMMGRRNYAVQTATAQTHVIGKRHFGLKALPTGGGGGKEATRELFDTLLLWKGRLMLDAKGEVSAEIPLNDSLTSFRVVAVASAGLDRFGTGSTSFSSTQDLMILSGVAPLVRQGDRYRSEFTVRNTTEKGMEVQVSARVREVAGSLSPLTLSLAPGEARVVGWDLTAPLAVDSLRYEVEAKGGAGISDRLVVTQKVVPAVPVRPIQATLAQLEGNLLVDVDRPRDAIPNQGGVQVQLRPTLLNGLTGVTDYMKSYPYTCLEQDVSKAISLREEMLWNRLMDRLPSYLDAEGLAKYFPSGIVGSEILTSYLVSIADEAGWNIPPALKERMLSGLRGFVEGRVLRHSSLPTADLSIRKVMAIEALSRAGVAQPGLLSSVFMEPNLWPTSAVVDWLNILQRVPGIRDRSERIREADQILRTRLNFQGTTMGFSTERTDFLWWLMVSTDTNAVRLLLSQLNSASWREDMPRLVRGALGRQRRGHWDITVANAWGVLAMEKFSKTFEKSPVTGTVTARLGGNTQGMDWSASPTGKSLEFAWPSQRSQLSISASGSGRPWVTVQSRAAIPLQEPFSTGYRIKKTLIAIEQKQAGTWNKGDVVSVRLQVEAQADMTWVVLTDPIPAGATILGTGLGGDSRLLTRGGERERWLWPAFQERSFESYRAYYDYFPKGEWAIEYTVRLNNAGLFNLPTTRVEAMYSPEMFGEIPNDPMTVRNNP